ncbi:MAG: VTT domain-containing protein [Desulfovibrio sp.]|jgi:uncharacterized membrane protein YdjX (TVP38/TMEM64 family)|nr:VTT domain-containing protein [Desulfovibrio sp.]
MSSPILKMSLFFLGLAGVIACVHLLDLQELLDPAFADTHLRQNGGTFLYIALVMFLSPLGFPRQGLAVLGGYAFGALSGTLLTLAGLSLGCAAGFFYARILARPALQKRFGKKIQRLDDFLSRNPFAMTVAVRCFPLGNNALTNLAAGLTSIPALPFFAGSCIGYSPQTLIFALLGSGLRVDPLWRILTAALLFVLASGAGVLIYRRYRDDLKGSPIPDPASDPLSTDKA